MINIDNNTFHLTDGNFSYAFFVKNGKLVHTYFGRAIPVGKTELFSTDIGENFELGEQGRYDFRIPSVVVHGDRFASTNFEYVSHKIFEHKPDIGLPATRGGKQTLEIKLIDKASNVEAFLYYTVVGGALARSLKIVNRSNKPVRLLTAQSLCVELPPSDYDYITLSGSWACECGITRRPVTDGIHSVSSTRGITSHRYNPFIAVVGSKTTEEHGDAYGFNIIYSGNHSERIERDEQGAVRVDAGVDLLEGGIELAAGEEFQTPEAIAVYSHNGLGGMSRIFHKLCREHIIDPRFVDKPRPVVVNSWESMYFDFDEDKLLKFVDGAKGLGIDTVVLDDGWFGHRDNDDSSLGDWFIDKRKLPNGLKPVIDRCKANGLKFGIWFEPEAISPDSELYRDHPDWAIATVGREGVQSRNQFVLDFSKREVVDNIFEQMQAILSTNDISYVKWDMNRSLSDVDDAKKYVGYVRGVYDLYSRLTREFPELLIEGCSGGGGRFDFGIMYYSPLIWTSDDTDAHERTLIQYGASLCYPLQTMSNHVSVCPNHQTFRTTEYSTRGAVASLGCLGYELNVSLLKEDEREIIKRQVANYRADAELILSGELYRLASPYDGGAFCQEVVSPDGKNAYVVFVDGLIKPGKGRGPIKLKGLDPQTLYVVAERNIAVTGAELMYRGLVPHTKGDFGAEILHIKAVKN